VSYSAITDFIALLRQTSGGVRTARMPGLDFVVAALARAGLFQVSYGATAPTINQSATLWFKPASQSWTGEGGVYLWNAATQEYEPATPALWLALLSSSAGQPEVQDVVGVNVPVLVGVSVVRVQNVGAPVTLTVPLASTMAGPVLITDWANGAGTNNITVNLSGTDKFPGNLSTWKIAADGGSIYLRPVPGGFAL